MKARLLAVLASAMLAAGCGIQPTGVIQAGPGPQIRGTESTRPPGVMTLYFVADGRVTPVDRPAVGVATPETAIALLLKGPTADESALGFTTFVPYEVDRVQVFPGNPPIISLPFSAYKLSGQAVNQLVCTATAAYSARDTPLISPGMNVSGPDGQTYFQACKSG